MVRRTFFAAVAGLVAWARPRPLFADTYRVSQSKWNGNGKEHTEYSARAVMPYTALEDAEAFHARAEQVRLSMLDLLKKEGAPINVWRVTPRINGGTEYLHIYDGSHTETRQWIDAHYFYVRTRCSVERPPFTYLKEVTP